MPRCVSYQMKFSLFLFLSFFLLLSAAAQTQTAVVQGRVRSEEGQPMEQVNVFLSGSDTGFPTDKSGRYRVTVPAQQHVTIIFSFVGFSQYNLKVNLKPGQVLDRDVMLKSEAENLNEVTVSDPRSKAARDQVSITKLSPRSAKFLPSPFGEFNRVLTTLPGVVSNNELSSTYSVRGGSYDENLIYVDNFEIYRPYLVSNGQQEGLSFVNPDMVADIEFSSGGWQPKYADKLSSVLSIKYKRPVRFGGTATASLTGGAIQLEGAARNNRFTYNIGTRYKNAAYMFKFLNVEGNYRPRFIDYQAYLTYDLSADTAGRGKGRTILSLLASFAQNKYRVTPTSGETRFGSIQRTLQVNIFFDGHDLVDYNTYQGGLSLRHRFTEKVSSELIVSAVHSREREFRDIDAAYRFCEVNSDPGSGKFGECENAREVGATFSHSRNTLLSQIMALENRTTWTLSPKHEIQAGARLTNEDLRDNLYEYSFTDSADYVVPASFSFLSSENSLQSQRINGYVQHSWQLDSLKKLTYGTRASYWTINQELIFGPRAQLSVRPRNSNRLTYKFATGLYYQPPFYRELRNFDGEVNRDLKAQRSYHFIAGGDYLFKAWGRDFKFRTEAYYKHMTNVVPYDVENVRIRYYGRNNAKAYATGIDMRVNGEFIRGAESWFSLGYLNTKEDVQGDRMIVFEQQGRNLIPVDTVQRGYMRRPTDQHVTLGVFFQDHLPNNPTLKMYLNLVYGSGLVTGVPNNQYGRNTVRMPSYRRVDIGFSKLITFRDEVAERKGVFQSLWLGLEVLNLLAAPNTVSYNFVKDLDNRRYAIPNYTTSRVFNLRMIARF